MRTRRQAIVRPSKPPKYSRMFKLAHAWLKIWKWKNISTQTRKRSPMQMTLCNLWKGCTAHHKSQQPTDRIQRHAIIAMNPLSTPTFRDQQAMLLEDIGSYLFDMQLFQTLAFFDQQVKTATAIAVHRHAKRRTAPKAEVEFYTSSENENFVHIYRAK